MTAIKTTAHATMMAIIDTIPKPESERAIEKLEKYKMMFFLNLVYHF
jgi:hypothetical protein